MMQHVNMCHATVIQQLQTIAQVVEQEGALPLLEQIHTQIPASTITHLVIQVVCCINHHHRGTLECQVHQVSIQLVLLSQAHTMAVAVSLHDKAEVVRTPEVLVERTSIKMYYGTTVLTKYRYSPSIIRLVTR